MEMKFTTILNAGIEHLEKTVKAVFIGARPVYQFDSATNSNTTEVIGYKYSLNFGDYGVLDVKVLGEKLVIKQYSYVSVVDLQIGQYNNHLWAKATTLNPLPVK